MPEENFMDRMRREHSPEIKTQQDKEAYLGRFRKLDLYIDEAVKTTKFKISENWDKHKFSGYLIIQESYSDEVYSLFCLIDNGPSHPDWTWNRYAFLKSPEELEYFVNGYKNKLKSEGITNVQIKTKPHTVKKKEKLSGVLKVFSEITATKYEDQGYKWVKDYDSFIIHIDIYW